MYTPWRGWRSQDVDGEPFVFMLLGLGVELEELEHEGHDGMQAKINTSKTMQSLPPL